MDPSIDSNSQLCTNAVCAADKYWITETSRLQIKDAAEASNVGICTRTTSGLDEGLDSIDKRVTGVDRHSGLRVCQTAIHRLSTIFQSPDTMSW